MKELHFGPNKALPDASTLESVLAIDPPPDDKSDNGQG